MSDERAEAPICPTCGLPVLGADYSGPWVPSCNPIRSPDCWRITGKATPPHPITGARTMLSLVPSHMTALPEDR